MEIREFQKSHLINFLNLNNIFKVFCPSVIITFINISYNRTKINIRKHVIVYFKFVTNKGPRLET